MEREYTISALLVLVVIFVIALIIYFTVPEFSQSVKQIADDVFGTSVKARQLTEEQYKQEEAKKVFESIKKCIEQLKEKKEGGCTCYLDYKELPKEYYIRTSEDNKELRLEKGNLKVPETTNINIEGLKFCMLEKTLGFTPFQASVYINSKGGTLQINDAEFLKYTPELYSLKKDGNLYTCFITKKLEGEDAIKLRGLKDCKSETVVLEETSKEKFKNFINLYRKCKENKGIRKCKCGIINFEEIAEPYAVQVSQQASGTEFYLKNTNLTEIVVYNKIAKLSSRLLGGYSVEKFKEKEGIERKTKEIIYYGHNQEIYLANPKDVTKLPLCVGGINIYLKFDNTLTEEEYRQKLIKFSKESKPAFEAETYFKTLYSAAKTNNVDFFIVAAMITQESKWDPKAISYTGAAGIMQLMPDIAKDMKLFVPDYKKSGKYSACNANAKQICDMKKDERFDPNKNINAGVRYVRWIIDELDKDSKLDPTFENILASYNAGLDAVKKAKGIPSFKETKDYVNRVCGYYEQLNTKVCYA